MANEETSPASEGGAAQQGEQQAAEVTEQSGSQGQSTESSQVEGGESQASSGGNQTRQKSFWANQRQLEKIIERKLSSALDDKLTPIVERFNQPQNPSVSTTQNGQQIDYNDLDGSINRLIEARIQDGLKGTLGKSIPSLKEELLNEISTRTSRQDARKYLLSQKDIGNDASKHEEIENIIMNDKILYNSVGEYPMEVMQQAVDKWRTSRKNPMAPQKEELSTITGGMGAVQRGGEVSLDKLRAMQEKVLRSDLPRDERDKLNREIDDLMSFK